jgi:nanoRNase/pAp phosphatase (c-di-AMP/oligoRNAs hydrolase)
MPESFKQAAEKLNAAGSVLVVLPPLASPDTVAASLGLFNYLKKLDKDAVVVASDGLLNPQVEFLPGYGQVLRELSLVKGFVIDVSTRRTDVAELSYKKEDGRISVYLKPKSGEFTPEDVTFRTAKFPYDAIAVVGADKLESLGGFYARNAELFFETPVVNIDHKGSNTGFGQLNVVNLNASSDSEVVYDLVSEMGRELVDHDASTALLAGMIAETNSFQHGKTTPQSFMKASQLVESGAKQQDIVTQLFRSKSMGFLKLWGRALARLKSEPSGQLAIASVTADDVAKSGASAQDVAAILKEMSTQLAFAKVHVFFRETADGSTEVFCSGPSSLALASALSSYQPASTQPQAMRFTVPLPMAEAEPQVMATIRAEASKLS